jgi:Terminase large subunit, T4likevirus-type, N-terminal
VSTARLAEEVRRLRERHHRRRVSAEIASDRAEFARMLGIMPDDWQERLLRSDSDRILINAARQSGKSTTTAIIALHRALWHPSSLILCLAPSLRQSQELFGKIAGFYRDLDRPVLPKAERKLSMELENGSRIVTLPGTEKTIRGFSGAALLVVDEAARVDDELYYAVRPMLAVSGGALLMLSTPAGKRGVFHEEWTNGTGWERYRVTAKECPRVSEAFLEEERRALPTWVYEQEYRCVFHDTEDAVFTHELVTGAVSPEVKPIFGGD